MTLTELRYVVAVARERHFGRAADACFVSQPTLSVAIKKLEDELNVQLFERGGNEISVTALGQTIVEQAQRVLEQAQAIRELAKLGRDPLAGPLRVGVIYTIGPYLLPSLVRKVIDTVPQMPLLLQENFTVKLLELLRQGELDVAILAEPFVDHGLQTQAVYDEPFRVALPLNHPWSGRNTIDAEELKQENMLLLGNGHCFRDHVMGVCPEMARFAQASDGIQKTFEGSSLETIRHMVAAGVGVTVLPCLATPDGLAHERSRDKLLDYIPFSGAVPTRRVVLAWRKSFTRLAAVQALRSALLQCRLGEVQWLVDAPIETHA